MQRIQAPEGVSALMRELWETHQRGEFRKGCNVFFVDLPPLTEEESRQLRVDGTIADIDPAEEGCPI